MVQILIDYRHLARARPVTVRREGTFVAVSFEVTSVVSHRSKTYSSYIHHTPSLNANAILQRAWTDILGRHTDDLRAFVVMSTKMPAFMEPLDLFPIGDDSPETIDISLIDGPIDGYHIEDNSVTSDQIASLDASKLTGTISVDRLRHSGMTMDMITGSLDPQQIRDNSITSDKIISVDADRIVGRLSGSQLDVDAITDMDIVDVDCKKIFGTLPERVLKQTDISLLNGILAVSQLPDYIPESKLHPDATISLDALTHGVLDSSRLAPDCVHSHHIREVSSSCLTGHISSSLLEPNSVTAEHIVSVDASCISGYINITSIETQDLVVDETIHTASLHAEEVVTDALHVNQTLCADSVYIAHDVVATHITSDEIDVSTDATVRRLEVQDALIQSGVCQSIEADVIDCRQMESPYIACEHMGADTLQVGQFLAKHITSDSLDARCIVAPEMRTNNLEAEIMYCQEVTVGSTLKTGYAEVDTVTAENAVISDQVTAHVVTSDSLRSHLATICSLDCEHGLVNELMACTLNVETTHSDILHANKMMAKVIESQELTAYNFQTSECNASSVVVSGDMSLRGDVRISGDVLVSGQSLTALVSAMAARISSLESVVHSPAHISFGRSLYYVDTQHATSHDALEILNPFTDSVIKFTTLSHETHGLDVTTDGTIHGTAYDVGARYTIHMRASTTIIDVTYATEQDIEIMVLGPPVWTPVPIEVVVLEQMDSPLVASDATHFFMDNQQDYPDIYIEGDRLKGSHATVGVHALSVTAARHLLHNEHVLQSSHVIDVTVRPLPPDIISDTSWSTNSDCDATVEISQSSPSGLDVILDTVEWIRLWTVEGGEIVQDIEPVLDISLDVLSGCSVHLIYRGSLPTTARIKNNRLYDTSPVTGIHEFGLRALAPSNAYAGIHDDLYFKIVLRPLPVIVDAIPEPPILLGQPISLGIEFGEFYFTSHP